ncbi:MAG: tRNA-dihydrouridine synthase family protein [Candidatus Methanomethylophilaceae archaeon]|jgi:tRNA-dihydrouridine synthase B
MWKIGDLKIDGRVVLGPMSGVTSRSYRDFMKPFGVALSVTEMTSDVGVIHGLRRSMDYLRFGPNPPTALQLFGSDPSVLAQASEAALKANRNIDVIDINMGCPVAKVVRNGSGSALMKDPKKCGDIIRSIKRTVDVPVTAKIRLGYGSNINYEQVIDELEGAEVDAVTIHARTMEERYTGTPHYDLIRGLQERMSVPLIISGNIYSLDDAINDVGMTGASGIMVARGGVGNPFLITQIDRYYRTGEKLPNPTIDQQVDWCLELADGLIAEKGEELAMNILRGVAPKFISGCYRSRAYRNRLAIETTDLESLKKILFEIRDRMGSERIRTECLSKDN